MRNEICLEVGSVACEFIGLLPCLFTSICVGLVNRSVCSASRSSRNQVTYIGHRHGLNSSSVELVHKFVVQPKFVELEIELVLAVERVLLIPSLNRDVAVGPEPVCHGTDVGPES